MGFLNLFIVSCVCPVQSVLYLMVGLFFFILNPNAMQTNTATTRRPAQRRASKTVTKSPRGFAAMDPEQQRRIASEGGKASHASGRGHRFTSEEARAAGRKGGMASRTSSTTAAR